MYHSMSQTENHLNIILCADADGKVLDKNIFVEGTNILCMQAIGSGILFGHSCIMTDKMFGIASTAISYYCSKMASLSKPSMLAEVGKRAMECDNFGTLSIFGDSSSYNSLSCLSHIDKFVVIMPRKRNALFACHGWTIKSISHLIPAKWDIIEMMPDKNLSIPDSDGIAAEIDNMESWLNEEQAVFSESDEKDFRRVIDYLKMGTDDKFDAKFGEKVNNAFNDSTHDHYSSDDGDDSYNEYQGEDAYNDMEPELPPPTEEEISQRLDNAMPSIGTIKALTDTITMLTQSIIEIKDDSKSIHKTIDDNAGKYVLLQQVVNEALQKNTEYTHNCMTEMGDTCDGIRTQIGNIVREQNRHGRQLTILKASNRAPLVMNIITVVMLIITILINCL